MRALFLAVLLAAPAGAVPGRGPQVAVVLPHSPAAPYQEALHGLCKALDGCPRVFAPGESLPSGTRVVIALGGRAARASYPSAVSLVTALTPGFEARDAGEGAVVRVRLTPSPEDFARRLLSRRPGLRRAVLLWSDPVSGRFADAARRAAAARGVDLVPRRVPDPSDVPESLRALPDADAVWLAPDPELVTPMTFDAVREYARSRGETFFAPAPGLASRGADPALAPSFEASGRRAGKVALDLLDGLQEPDTAYPEAEDEDPTPVASTGTRAAP
jgi:hypothetical protein